MQRAIQIKATAQTPELDCSTDTRLLLGFLAELHSVMNQRMHTHANDEDWVCVGSTQSMHAGGLLLELTPAREAQVPDLSFYLLSSPVGFGLCCTTSVLPKYPCCCNQS